MYCIPEVGSRTEDGASRDGAQPAKHGDSTGLCKEKQNAMSEKGRSERIRELQGEQAHIESELRQLRSLPEKTARSTVPRSEFSDQPTRSMKESLESLPGVAAQQGSSGRNTQISIRGSKCGAP